MRPRLFLSRFSRFFSLIVICLSSISVSAELKKKTGPSPAPADEKAAFQLPLFDAWALDEWRDRR